MDLSSLIGHPLYTDIECIRVHPNRKEVQILLRSELREPACRGKFVTRILWRLEDAADSSFMFQAQLLSLL